MSVTSLLSNQSHGFLARLYTATTETTSKLVSELLYIDDLKSFASSESKLKRVMESPKSTMEDSGPQ